MSWNGHRRPNQMSNYKRNNGNGYGEWQTQTEELLIKHTDDQIEELSTTVKELKGVNKQISIFF